MTASCKLVSSRGPSSLHASALVSASGTLVRILVCIRRTVVGAWLAWPRGRRAVRAEARSRHQRGQQSAGRQTDQEHAESAQCDTHTETVVEFTSDGKGAASVDTGCDSMLPSDVPRGAELAAGD